MIIDLRPACTYTEFFVVCTGGNPRQTHAIWDEVRERMKRDHGLLPHTADADREATWIVGDYLDVVLHVFTPEARAYYRLEELWSDLPSVELEAATA